MLDEIAYKGSIVGLLIMISNPLQDGGSDPLEKTIAEIKKFKYGKCSTCWSNGNTLGFIFKTLCKNPVYANFYLIDSFGCTVSLSFFYFMNY